jgi:crotonobetainyl-CoA:carnitine CoA-transferase CaiB-like acyl-CoA transferase
LTAGAKPGGVDEAEPRSSPGPARGSTPRGALAGLRVLDLTTLLSAPQVAAMLADFGAEVVKVEPREGDPLRRIGAARAGRSLAWALVARGKRAVTLDLDREEGRALFARMALRADVLVENLPTPLLARWGCDYASLAQRNPRLVVVSVSCYGRSGPHAERPGAGSVAEAFAGLTHLTGEAAGPPLLTSVPIGDTLAAVAGVVGALAACWSRDAGKQPSGRGQHVDVSMFEPVLQLLATSLVAWDPREPPPGRSGSRIAGGVPRNVYRARDGRWLALSATTDAQVARVLRLVDRDTPEARERFGTSPARLAHADELDALVAGWVAGRDAEGALAACLEARLPAAAVHDLAQVQADPHVAARGSVVRVRDEALGELALVAPVPRLSATPGRIRGTGPALGAHNAEVYLEWLGIGRDELARLVREGIV